jgi:hypothetical protein
MNANELADKLDMVRIELTLQASTMLRQQQAEIEELKAEKLIHDEAYLSQMKEIQLLKKIIQGEEA